MNHLNTYKIFETLNSRGSRSLTEKEFDVILKKNCKNWTKAKTSLYRGQTDLGPYVYTDPKGKYRNSIEDTNMHLELIDNLPSWKDYPKYSESVIGISDNITGAGGYGSTYEIIPFDDVSIAVCPESTIWQSFGEDEWGDDIYLVRDFLESIGIDAEVWMSEAGRSIEDKLKSIEQVNKINTVSPVNDFLKRMIRSGYKKTISEISGEDCFNFINNYIFNPNIRNFNLIKYEAGFEIEKGKQIWTGGPVLLIYNNLV